MATTKGKIVREYPVTVTHDDTHTIVKFDGNTYKAYQDGWTSEAGAVREAVTFLLDTVGCWVEVQPAPLHHNGTKWTKGAGHYVMRLRVKGE